MSLSILKTGDGSNTLFHSDFNENYHSINGAISESEHVFIEAGLKFVAQKQSHIRILEIGFGTGLNTILTLLEAENLNLNIEYIGIEPFLPVFELLSQLQYFENYSENNQKYEVLLSHAGKGEKYISEHFNFSLFNGKFEDYFTNEVFDLIYFDAFAPLKQAEMWNVEVFEKCAKMSKTGTVLVSYCAQGQFRRNLQAAGYETERLPGPVGKREMTRAVKI